MVEKVDNHTYHPCKSFRVMFQSRSPVFINSFLQSKSANIKNRKNTNYVHLKINFKRMLLVQVFYERTTAESGY